MSKIETKILNIENNELVIDNSGFSDYHKCPMLYLYKQVYRQESVEASASALNFGSAIHLWLENFYLQKSVEECDRIMQKHFQENPQGLDDFRSKENASRLMTSYLEHYNITERDYDPLGVEIPFKVKLGEVELAGEVMGWDRLYKEGEVIEIHWSGKIDLLVKDTLGNNMLVDHKTTSRMGFNYFTQFRLSSQFRGYCYAVNNLMGDKVGWTQKFMINALQLTAKGNIEFARQEFMLNKEMILEWQRKTMQEIEGLVGMASAGEWGCSGWKNCAWMWGRSCPYCMVCETREDMREDVLFSGAFKKYHWNPLSS